MSKTKISELPQATTVANADELVVVQGGVTKRAARNLVGSGAVGPQGIQGIQGLRGPQGLSGTQDAFDVVTTDLYTASVGQRILTNISAAITITLPASPTAGSFVMFVDGDGAWATNSVTLGRNGNTIEGASEDLVLDVNDAWAELYYDGSDWKVRSAVGVAGPAGATGPQGATGPTGTFSIADDEEIAKGTINNKGITPLGLANTQPSRYLSNTWGNYSFTSAATPDQGEFALHSGTYSVSNTSSNTRALYDHIRPDSYFMAKCIDDENMFEEGRVEYAYVDHDSGICEFKLYDEHKVTGANSFNTSNTFTITTEGKKHRDRRENKQVQTLKHRTINIGVHSQATTNRISTTNSNARAYAHSTSSLSSTGSSSLLRNSHRYMGFRAQEGCCYDVAIIGQATYFCGFCRSTDTNGLSYGLELALQYAYTPINEYDATLSWNDCKLGNTSISIDGTNTLFYNAPGMGYISAWYKEILVLETLDLYLYLEQKIEYKNPLQVIFLLMFACLGL